MMSRLLLKLERRASRCLSVPTNAFSGTSVPTPEKKTMQVFSCPTSDRIAKYVLSQDETVRIDVLKAFTGISSISSATQLDEHYNPFDPLINLRRLINSRSCKGIFEDIQKAAKVELLLDGKENKHSFDVLRKLSNLNDDLAHAFPSHRNRSTVDFLCDTEDYGYITIEFQVAKEDYWDKRALAYICNIYGKQLRAGGEYTQIRNVIGVNLLGDGSTPYWNDGKFTRDYTLVDQLDSRKKIPALRLIQYSLGDADLNHPDLKQNEQLRQWIEYFKSAHEREAPPLAIGESVKKAYEMIRVDTLKANHPELLKSSEDMFLHLTEHNKAVARKAAAEASATAAAEATAKISAIAQNLLKIGMSAADVAQNTGLPEDQVRKLVPG